MNLGSYLIDFAAKYVFSKGTKLIEVVTQDDNEPAKKLYLRNGFTVSNDQIWFHKWK